MNERRSLKRCPTPTKDRYRHEAEAIRARDAAAAGYGWAMTHYQCTCERWHIARDKTPARVV